MDFGRMNWELIPILLIASAIFWLIQRAISSAIGRTVLRFHRFPTQWLRNVLLREQQRRNHSRKELMTYHHVGARATEIQIALWYLVRITRGDPYNEAGLETFLRMCRPDFEDWGQSESGSPSLPDDADNLTAD